MRSFAVLALAGTFLLFEPGWLQPAAAQSTPPASSASSPQPKAKSAKTAHGKTSAARPGQKKTSQKKRRKPISPRVRRVRQAFAASANLRPMAQQLLQDRTPAAYAGVEAYARRHAKEDAGALAWLVIGYARMLDHEYAKAIDPLNRAKAGASELGDYVTYYLGDAYLKTGHNAEALAALADFSKNFPDSLLIRDAHLVYATVLLEEGRAPEAASLLEKDRAPLRSDIELAIGRAYEAAGEKQKAADAFRNLYFNLPNSFEADAAGAELRKLGITGSIAERRTRADLLF
ncbi:MAG: tetratricopeptide repeat protein, partial [Terriglobales bacterium]